MIINFNDFSVIDLKRKINVQRASNALALCLEIKELGGIKYMKTWEIDAQLGTGADSKILRQVLTKADTKSYRKGGGSIGYGVNKDEFDKLFAVLKQYRDTEIAANPFAARLRRTVPSATAPATLFVDASREIENA